MSGDWLLVVFGLLALGLFCLDRIDTYTPRGDDQ